eukprot:CAMPEP_0184682148 /NCGR_PEP_ID=MMETSP0312-20130426/5976_1 /TAXON_ID=31354 /ORGANISM="Compsopogon coeruleus, Strain SAG 36.94" /LENGTH=110 /DNA_ID=CAMNT_0027133563 /DNA_START=179 /DNA_END=511 /DNA_ORIENTATION=+
MEASSHSNSDPTSIPLAGPIRHHDEQLDKTLHELTTWMASKDALQKENVALRRALESIEDHPEWAKAMPYDVREVAETCQPRVAGLARRAEQIWMQYRAIDSIEKESERK